MGMLIFPLITLWPFTRLDIHDDDEKSLSSSFFEAQGVRAILYNEKCVYY
jgi:hypothetical protein